MVSKGDVQVRIFIPLCIHLLSQSNADLLSSHSVPVLSWKDIELLWQDTSMKHFLIMYTFLNKEGRFHSMCLTGVHLDIPWVSHNWTSIIAMLSSFLCSSFWFPHFISWNGPPRSHSSQNLRIAWVNLSLPPCLLGHQIWWLLSNISKS